MKNHLGDLLLWAPLIPSSFILAKGGSVGSMFVHLSWVHSQDLNIMMSNHWWEMDSLNKWPVIQKAFLCSKLTMWLMKIHRDHHCKALLITLPYIFNQRCHCKESLIARSMGPTWGPSGADRTQMGHMLVTLFAVRGICLSRWTKMFEFQIKFHWNIFLMI